MASRAEICPVKMSQAQRVDLGVGDFDCGVCMGTGSIESESGQHTAVVLAARYLLVRAVEVRTIKPPATCVNLPTATS